MEITGLKTPIKQSLKILNRIVLNKKIQNVEKEFLIGSKFYLVLPHE
jgi:hypothetical protein